MDLCRTDRPQNSSVNTISSESHYQSGLQSEIDDLLKEII